MPRYYRKRPYRKYPAKKKSRYVGPRKSRKSKAKYRSGPSMCRMPSLVVGDMTGTKLKYEARIELASVAGAGISHQFSGNSVFDPDLTGVGVQPLGYDQWSALYDRYRVNGSAIKVRFIAIGIDAATNSWEVCLVPSPVTTTFSSMDAARASPYSIGTAKNMEQQGGYLRNYMSTAKIEGVSKTTVRVDDEFSSIVSSNPTEQWAWNVIGQPADRSTSASLIAFVSITYYVTFYSRKRLGMS